MAALPPQYRLLQLLGRLEAASFLVLLGIAMPLKYLAHDPRAVRVFGMLHGLLFVLYILALLRAVLDGRLSLRLAALAFGASFLPAGPFWIEGAILRSAEATASISPPAATDPPTT
jgi:integral membrane protein